MQELSLQQQLIQLLEPECITRGFELVTVEISGSRNNPVITVMIDTDNGVDLETILAANTWIDALLDIQDVVKSSYTLEVSSPGVDRPLRKPSDYQRFVGNSVVVRTSAGPGERSVFKGVLKGLVDGFVVVACDGENESVDISIITKARLKGVVDFKNSDKE